MDRFLKDLYAMAGHWATTVCPIINDEISYRMTSEKEYPLCRQQAEQSVQLLADRLFMHNAYIAAEKAGARQFVMVHCGYETYHIRHSLWYGGVNTFDINPACVAADKQRRLAKAGYRKVSKTYDVICDNPGNIVPSLHTHPQFDSSKTTFIHLGALLCETSGESFKQLMDELFKIIPPASSVTFSYDSGVYSYDNMEKLLSQSGFHIYEHMTAGQLHREYIQDFELLNSRSFFLADNIGYCLAVKKIRG